jgi:hypothetical protein
VVVAKGDLRDCSMVALPVKSAFFFVVVGKISIIIYFIPMHASSGVYKRDPMSYA